MTAGWAPCASVRIGLALVLVLGRATVLSQPRPAIVLDGATVMDGTGAPPCADCRVAVREHRIEAMGPASRAPVPGGAEPLDLAGAFVLPGLIDHHFHIENDPRLALRH